MPRLAPVTSATDASMFIESPPRCGSLLCDQAERAADCGRDGGPRSGPELDLCDAAGGRDGAPGQAEAPDGCEHAGVVMEHGPAQTLDPLLRGPLGEAAQQRSPHAVSLPLVDDDDRPIGKATVLAVAHEAGDCDDGAADHRDERLVLVVVDLGEVPDLVL